MFNKPFSRCFAILSSFLKIKVLRSDTCYSYDDYESQKYLYPISMDWEEVTATRREEIRQAVRNANQMYRNNGYYIMVEYNANTMTEMFATASAFAEKIRKDQEKAEKAHQAAKAKKDAAAAARKPTHWRQSAPLRWARAAEPASWERGSPGGSGGRPRPRCPSTGASRKLTAPSAMSWSR